MERPVAPAPEVVDVAPIRKQLVRQNLVGVSLFARAARKTAKREADQAARSLAELQFAERERVSKEQQGGLDSWWADLLANDPATTTEFMNQAFEDNSAVAVVTSVSGADASIVVIVPPDSVVPDRIPSTTAVGNLSLKKLTKTELSAWYLEVVCGHTMVTVKEGFAVAPGIETISIVAIRTTAASAFGTARFDALLAGSFHRDSLQSVRWDVASASTITREASADLIINYKGSTHSISPIDLSQQPELGHLMASIDIDELN